MEENNNNDGRMNGMNRNGGYWRKRNENVGKQDMNVNNMRSNNVQNKDRIIVDQYLNKRLHPSIQETKDWTKDMISYFKEKWEEDRLKEKNSTDENIKDVIENEDQVDHNWLADEIWGGDTTVLN
ncbi:hypothetical protein Tco_0086401 [Tanacetum coccineum]